MFNMDESSMSNFPEEAFGKPCHSSNRSFSGPPKIKSQKTCKNNNKSFYQYLKILFRIVDNVTKIASSVLIVLEPCPVGITFNQRSNKSETFSTPLFVNSSS